MVELHEGLLRIVQEGRVRKFVESVEQIGFAADSRFRRAKQVYYVTERAVFRLCDEGLELMEIAPGINVENDILAHMSFRPIIRHIQPMPAHCFSRSISSAQSGFRH